VALLISPKTTEKSLCQLKKFFDLKKVPKSDAYLEFGNFNDNLYYADVGKIPLYVILTGYGGASVGFAIAQYEKNYLAKDPFPEAYFAGSVLKSKRAHHLQLADILYANDTYGEDEWTQAIYRAANLKKINYPGRPDPAIVKRVQKIAKANNITLKTGKILCRWHPGTLKNYRYIIDLLDDGMWWKFALSEGKYSNHNYDGGEIESASFLATCKLAKIPALAILDVRDERVDKTPSGYRLADADKKAQAQEDIVFLIRASIEELGNRSMVKSKKNGKH